MSDDSRYKKFRFSRLSKDKKKLSKQDSATANWYAKLHPIGKDPAIPIDKSPRKRSKKILNLSLFFRIWIAVALIIIISGIVVFNQLFNYVKPVTRQVVEDTLVDTAKLLASSLQPAVKSGEIYSPAFQSALDSAFTAPELPTNKKYVDRKQLDTLSKWYHQKTHSSFRVYVTDAKGIVIYDSRSKSSNQNEEVISPKDIIGNPNDLPNAEGEDYSRWNDVYLTLKGKYGARSTRHIPDNPDTSVMYVAQPIYNSTTEQKEIIGVVSVGKPTATILPYLNATRQRMLNASYIISIIALIMAGLISWWLRQSTMLVTRYTQALAQETKKPYFYLGKELNELSDTIESMKHRLENRAYVTDYVHTLTHELKSPLTAIRASGELLEETDLDGEDRLMLSQTITEQSIKLQSLIDRLLLLAKIEQPTFKLNMQSIELNTLLHTLIDGSEIQRQQQQIQLTYEDNLPDNLTEILADEFWITQALQNVLDNALYFAHNKVTITLDSIEHDQKTYIKLVIFNDGDLIPDYALDKIFDRYFSLSHQYAKPNTQSKAQSQYNDTNDDSNSNHVSNSQANNNSQAKKGTGLGLTLVKQVIERHGGHIIIQNKKANLDNKKTDTLISTQTNTEIDNQDTGLLSNAINCQGVEVIIYLPTHHEY